MNTRTQILCAWCGVLVPIVMFGGLWPAAGFIPPPAPTATAAEIAASFQENTTGIRIATLCMLIAGALMVPFASSISAQIRRIERGDTPVLTYAQLGAGIASVWLFFLPAMMWTVAAFRPERSPEVTQTLNDIAWMTFVMPFTLGFVQNLCIGFAILSDKRAQPIFPRWVAFFNVWTAVLFIPGGLLTFFKTGAFAWNGLLAFWVPAGVFGPWFFVMSAYVIKAAKQQAQTEIHGKS
ncbi:MAG: hypothetical protein ABW034_11915 [Steroidobacteraceae bacterium]